MSDTPAVPHRPSPRRGRGPRSIRVAIWRWALVAGLALSAVAAPSSSVTGQVDSAVIAASCDARGATIPADRACLVLVHAAPDVAAVDVSIGDDTQLVALGPGTRSLALLVPAAPVTIRYTLSADPGRVVAESRDFQPIGGALQEIALTGTAASRTLGLSVLPPLAPGASGNEAGLRVFLGVPDAPVADLVLGGVAIATAIAPGATAGPVASPLAPGIATLTVAGRDDILAAIPVGAVPGGSLATLYVVGSLTDAASISTTQVVISGPSEATTPEP